MYPIQGTTASVTQQQHMSRDLCRQHHLTELLKLTRERARDTEATGPVEAVWAHLKGLHACTATLSYRHRESIVYALPVELTLDEARGEHRHGKPFAYQPSALANARDHEATLLASVIKTTLLTHQAPGPHLADWVSRTLRLPARGIEPHHVFDAADFNSLLPELMAICTGVSTLGRTLIHEGACALLGLSHDATHPRRLKLQEMMFHLTPTPNEAGSLTFDDIHRTLQQHRIYEQ